VQTGRGKLAYELLLKVQTLLSAQSAGEACFFAVTRSLGLALYVRSDAHVPMFSRLGLAPTAVGALQWCLSAPRMSGILGLLPCLHACLCACVHVANRPLMVLTAKKGPPRKSCRFETIVLQIRDRTMTDNDGARCPVIVRHSVLVYYAVQ
jgi:hypothetical protein